MGQQYIIRGSGGKYYGKYQQGVVEERRYAYRYTKEEIVRNFNEDKYWLKGAIIIPTIPYNKEKQYEK